MTFDENDLRAVPRIPVLGDLPNRAVWRLTTATSRLGERRGIDWLTYEPAPDARLSPHRAVDSSRAIPVLAEMFPTASSYADVGAGSGAYAAEAQRRGKQVIAYEYSWSGRVLARLQGVDTRGFDLNEVNPGVTRSHGRPRILDRSRRAPSSSIWGPRSVEFLVRLAPVIVFTAAPPGTGGLAHVNERPPEYWIECFESHGSRYSAEDSRSLAEAFARAGVRGEWLTERPLVFLSNPVMPNGKTIASCLAAATSRSSVRTRGSASRSVGRAPRRAVSSTPDRLLNASRALSEFEIAINRFGPETEPLQHRCP